MDDRGVADVFYTLLSISIVAILGLVVAGTVLSATAHQGNEAASKMSGLDARAMKEGMYSLFYHTDPALSNYASGSPDDIVLKGQSLKKFDSIIYLNQGSLSPGMPETHGAAIWTGYLYVPMSGEYTIELRSRDGSWLWIDGTMSVDNGGVHASESSGSVRKHLAKGYHPIKLKFFYRDIDEASCSLLWDETGVMAPVRSLYR